MKEKKVLNISQVAPNFLYQGPRFKKLGPNSGEAFRDEILIPFLDELDITQQSGVVDFGNTKVFSPSFLEESFGGAIRRGYGEKIESLKFENIPEEWEDALKKYVKVAIRKGI